MNEIIIQLDRPAFDQIDKLRYSINENLGLTAFSKWAFNARLKHVAKHKELVYNHILEKWEVFLIFNSESDLDKYTQIINKSGPHWSWFLLHI